MDQEDAMVQLAGKVILAAVVTAGLMTGWHFFQWRMMLTLALFGVVFWLVTVFTDSLDGR